MSAQETGETGVLDAPGFWTQFLQAQKREGRRALIELRNVGELLPLLMKHRNGGAWSEAEREDLIRLLRHLSRLSPYLLFLLLPGSALLLPAYAWWLDRRRGRRH